MGDKTGISWADATWNVLSGCTRVSEGCRNCYAERLTATRLRETPKYKGLAVLKNISKNLDEPQLEARWTGEVRFHEEELDQPLRWQRPRRIFVNSMSDTFHDKVTTDEIDQIFAVMALARNHVFQVLTKRAVRMMDYCNDPDTRRRVALAILDRIKTMRTPKEGIPMPLVHRPDSTEERPLFWAQWPLPNVWLGVSAEDQETANERIPMLLETPAAVRWISAEPLLGRIELRQEWVPLIFGKTEIEPGIDWMVVGGESGPGARPMHPEWARFLRDQCSAAKVPFFMKQWGEWAPYPPKFPHEHQTKTVYGQIFTRVGKHNAGALLDGQEWKQYPR